MKITIIGGGITGLTTALALEKSGFPCQVFEKAPQLNEVGAGIMMQPNAMKVLDWLGIGASIRAAGASLNRVEITDKNLAPVRKLNRLSDNGDHRTITSIHRARLQKILSDALPNDRLQLGQAFRDFEVVKNGVKINFQDHSTQADLLLGADGIHSSVRRQMFPRSTTRYSGQTCWRGIVSFSLPQAHTQKGLEAWGQKMRFGFAPISETEVYWYAVARAPQGQAMESERVKQKLSGLFADFHPLIKELIQHTPADKILRNDISDLKRLPSWSQNRVCLIGDAAHATTPNLGQGGGQGVEDAYYLSHFLTQSNSYQEVFATFEKERRNKVDYIVNTSWRFGQLANTSLGQQLFKLMLKWTPEKMMHRQMDKMYSVEKLN